MEQNENGHKTASFLGTAMRAIFGRAGEEFKGLLENRGLFGTLKPVAMFAGGLLLTALLVAPGKVLPGMLRILFAYDLLLLKFAASMLLVFEFKRLRSIIVKTGRKTYDALAFSLEVLFHGRAIVIRFGQPDEDEEGEGSFEGIPVRKVVDLLITNGFSKAAPEELGVSRTVQRNILAALEGRGLLVRVENNARALHPRITRGNLEEIFAAYPSLAEIRKMPDLSIARTFEQVSATGFAFRETERG